jgi:Creatinase/Prolidase N-terminal domain
MKRGLVVLDPAEIPGGERRDRLTALQRRLAADDIDVALVYGDVSRPDDIAYLTNLCVYWNEGMLAVPAEGEPAFLTKLSPRVHPWMRRTSTITDVRSGRSFGDLVAKYLAAGRQPRSGRPAVGLIDAPLWPAAVVAEITAAASGWQVIPLGGLVREQRLAPSPHELALLRHAGGVTGAAVAAVERDLRGAGFLDVLAWLDETADGAVSVRVTAQYRNLWLHASRVSGATPPPWAAALGLALAAVTAAAATGVTADGLAAAAGPHLEGLPPGTATDVRWVYQADMATSGEYESYPADLPVPRGSVVVLTIAARFPDGSQAAVADTVLVGDDGADSLTGRAAR